MRSRVAARIPKIVSLLAIFVLVCAGVQLPGTQVAHAAANVIYLTSGTSWTVPSDWNSSNNTIEVIGGGGGGALNVSSSVGAGGGGAYSKKSNVTLTSGASVKYAIGSGGVFASGSSGNVGGDTFFCTSTSNCATIAGTAVVVGARGGSGGSGISGGAGGAATGVGDVKNSGGNGGNSEGGGDHTYGGGGGGAGPHGNGNNGQSVFFQSIGNRKSGKNLILPALNQKF